MDIIISSEYNNLVLRDFLFKNLKLSQNLVKRMKHLPNGITINGEHVTVRYVLHTGDNLHLVDYDLDQDVNTKIVPNNIPLDILYEDDYITIIDKPFNMPSHPSILHTADTVGNALVSRYKNKTYVYRPVNRLDKDTSGVMITANSREAASLFSNYLKKKKMQKNYLAIVHGSMSVKQGTISSYIKREEEGNIKRVSCEQFVEGSQLAITNYWTIASNNDYSLIIAQPVTGRTHQLRVHFSSCGCPIVGDVVYGEQENSSVRQMLHAFSIEFDHPKTQEHLLIKAKLPLEMKSFIIENFSNYHDILTKFE